MTGLDWNQTKMAQGKDFLLHNIYLERFDPVY